MNALLTWLLLTLNTGTSTVSETWGDDPAQAIVIVTHLSKSQIALSEVVQLTLTISGPAPLEVTPPKPLLSMSALWRTTELGLSTREILPNNRQRWQQVYRLSPLVPRAQVPIPIAPLVIRAGGKPPQTIELRTTRTLPVTTSITQPSLDQLRPITDLEETPASIESPPSSIGPMLIAGTLILASLIGILWYCWPKPLPTRHDRTWARAALTTANDPSQLVSIINEILGYYFQVSFQHQTTIEKINLLQQQNCPAAVAQAISRFYETADIQRFSGLPTDVTALREAGLAVLKELPDVLPVPQ